MSLLIKNARLNGQGLVDIKIKDEKIFQIGQDLGEEDCQIYDAKGRLTLPGGIDVHTHMALDLGEFVAVDDFYTGTRAAAYGGTTTIVDHIAFGSKDSFVDQMIDHYHDLADGKAVIDYSFYGAIQDAREKTLDLIGSLHQDQGLVSTKIYTTYGGKVDDKEILQI